MRITANFYQEVTIEPKDVIEKLLEKELGLGETMIKQDGEQFFKITYKNNRPDECIEITKESYEYINALKTILKNLPKR